MEYRNKLPLVSIGIPAYNHENYVASCIESLINQDYQNIEVIIINDGSQDNTHEVIMNCISECKDRFVRFEYRNRENKGLSATLNEMIKWSQGKYFSAFASDDILLENKISLLVDKLENLDETYAIAFGNAIFIDERGKKIYIDKSGELCDKERGVNLFIEYFALVSNRIMSLKDPAYFGTYQSFLKGNYLPAMSYIAKLDKIKDVGGWTDKNTIEDWEMWLKLSKKYKFAYIDKPVALYRLHQNNSTKTHAKDIVLDCLRILKKEKQYAIINNFENEYYEQLIRIVFELRRFSFCHFLVELFRNVTQYTFVKMLIKKSFVKLKNL
jgi:alpha-1,3-rhamnosyltransferase